MRMRRASGLTLLEMLVVLMIAGMAVTLAFQSLAQWRRANTAIAGATGKARLAILERDWLEASLRALAPAQPPFAGDADGLSGITLQPVLAGQGGNTPIEWRIRSAPGAVALSLREGGTEPRELPLDGVDRASFAYMAPDGRLHDRWPPALGLHDQLPAAILLRLVGRDGGERVWAAAIAGARNPVPLPFAPEEE